MTMSKALMPFNLRTLLALSAVLLASLMIAGSAAAATVNMRIESLTGTMFNGQVTTTGGNVHTTASSTCENDASPDVNHSTPNSLTALAGWASANNVAHNTQFDGTFLCRVGDVIGGATEYWLVKINNKTKAGGDYLNGSTMIKDGDSVLWYFTDDYSKKTLDVTLPATVQVGTAASGSVAAYDGADDSKSNVAGAAVNAEGASSTTAPDGSFQIVFPTAGRFLVQVTKAGMIRTSTWVTVTEQAAPVPPPAKTQAQLNKERRVAARAKCRADKSATRSERKACVRAANRIGRTLTPKQKRIAARASCARKYPTRGTRSRVRCVRAANRIGR